MSLALLNKIKKGLKLYKTIISLLLSLIITACQSPNSSQHAPTDTIAISTADFGQYYLSLKNLSADELHKEIALQQLHKGLGSYEAEMNLILLYSLSNSPIHNVYTAKSQLNRQLKKQQNDSLSLGDQAFIALLKDQLNQQLFLFQKLINRELIQDTEQAKNRSKEKKQLDKIATLELTVTQLTEQITQLKKIEQNISEHGK